MDFKGKMADMMMGKMTPEEKNVMMEQMMAKFFSDMKPEEKQAMMDSMMSKFMDSMTPGEKQGMMQSMMPKMMGAMMGGGSGSPMMNMMGMMMGGKGPMGMKRAGEETAGETTVQPEMPWDMCKKMMSSISRSSELATFATPEVRQLFEEWAGQIEEEIVAYIKDSKISDTEKIAEHFKLSRESVSYFLSRLAQKGKIRLKAE